MKQVLLLLSIVLLFFTVNTEAQLKPAQSQYSVNNGVLVNSNFEQGYKGWDISGGCSKSLVTVTPYLNKTLRLTCVAATFSVKQLSTSLVSFAGQQAAFDLQVKADADGVKVSSISNSIRNTEYSVITDTTFKRFKQIGVVANAINNGVETYSDTAFTGIVDIDNAYLGLSNLTQEIQGAHFVGSLFYNSASCIWSATNTGWGDFAVDPDCIATDITGDVTAPVTKIPAISINNPRLDGIYRVITQGLILRNAGSTCYFSLSSSANYENQGAVYTDAVVYADSTIEGNFRFTDTASKEIRIITLGIGGPNCAVYGAGNNDRKFTVHFFPDSKSTIATQDVELTAKTANELGFKVDFTTGLVYEDVYDIVNGNCSIVSIGVLSCSFNTGIFSDTPVFISGELQEISSADTNDDIRNIEVKALTSTAFRLRAKFVDPTSSGDFAPTNVAITFKKSKSEINKSQTIVGTFEQIRSDDLTMIEMQGGGADVVTANSTPIPFTVISSSDTKSEWDGNTFTPKSKGQFSFDGLMTFTSVATRFVSIVQTGSKNITYLCSENTTSTDDKIGIHCALNMEVGDTAEILSSGAGGTLKTDPKLRYLKITQAATQESIVANLMNKNITKCQTKYLSANTSAVGTIGDLTFNNLKTDGTGYSVELHHYADANALLDINNGGATIARAYDSSSQSIYTTGVSFFKATGTTVTFVKQNAVQTYGNGTGTDTFATLCELPETVIETTEFN